MNDNLAYDTDKLDVILDQLKKNYYEYTDSLDQLSKEIENLDTIWNTTNNSLYKGFKEKYEEKKPNLQKFQDLTKSLIDELSLKNNQLIEATEKTQQSFE